LKQAVQALEAQAVQTIQRSLTLLVSSHRLNNLTVYLPGIDGGDIFDVMNDNVYFSEEVFSNSTRGRYSCIPDLLARFAGLQTLTIGYTRDLELAAVVARKAGAANVAVRVLPEDSWSRFNAAEESTLSKQGWQIIGMEICKTHKCYTQVASVDLALEENRRVTYASSPFPPSTFSAR